jgi:hypothetical protein
MVEESGGNMRRFATLARFGFLATGIAVAGHAAVSVFSMRYVTRNLLDKGVLACLLAGLALSLLAIVTGMSARAGFRRAWGLYILASFSLVVSGWGLAITLFEIFRRVLWRFGVPA